MEKMIDVELARELIYLKAKDLCLDEEQLESLFDSHIACQCVEKAGDDTCL